MNTHSYRMMYDNVNDFMAVTVNIEAGLRQHEIRHDGDERQRDMWISKKTVSHFNLGIALELLMKMILSLEGVEYRPGHNLVKLHDLLPPPVQAIFESKYQQCFEATGGFVMRVFAVLDKKDDPPPLPPNRDVKTIRNMFEYFDEDVMLSEKRYSWELIGERRWRHYIDNLSAFTMLIQEVTKKLPSREYHTVVQVERLKIDPPPPNAS